MKPYGEVKPDANSPFGCHCVRGKAAPEIVHSPDRLTTPLMRTGARGEGKFREASWEEALDFIIDQMQKIWYPQDFYCLLVPLILLAAVLYALFPLG